MRKACAAHKYRYPFSRHFFKRIQGRAGARCQLDAAIDQHNAPQAGPKLWQGGQKIAHKLAAQLIVTTANGFCGYEHQSAAVAFCCGNFCGLLRGRGRSIRSGAYAPAVRAFLIYGNAEAAPFKKPPQILTRGLVVHQHFQDL